jgi:hypothetical protein
MPPETNKEGTDQGNEAEIFVSGMHHRRPGATGQEKEVIAERYGGQPAGRRRDSDATTRRERRGPKGDDREQDPERRESSRTWHVSRTHAGRRLRAGLNVGQVGRRALDKCQMPNAECRMPNEDNREHEGIRAWRVWSSVEWATQAICNIAGFQPFGIGAFLRTQTFESLNLN